MVRVWVYRNARTSTDQRPPLQVAFTPKHKARSASIYGPTHFVGELLAAIFGSVHVDPEEFAVDIYEAGDFRNYQGPTDEEGRLCLRHLRKLQETDPGRYECGACYAERGRKFRPVSD